MRLVIDALAARRGGLATYVRWLLTAWGEVAPEDDLTVLLTEPFGSELTADARLSGHRLLITPGHEPALAWRLARTEFLLPRLQGAADALLATLPVLPALWRKPAVAIVYDLRHEHRPKDFTLSQRVARRALYTSAYRRANRLLAISHRTADDLRNRHPGTASRTSVVHLGADHAPDRASTRDGDAIAFGHFTNKDPGLLLRVWRQLLQDPPSSVPRLHIVGLSALDRSNLTTQADKLKISQHVTLDLYVPAAQLDQLMRSASALLLPSRHEGFGLPVLEAMRQGVPVVISPDSALREVAAEYASCADSWTSTSLAVATRRALNMTRAEMALARLHAAGFSWRRTVELTRHHLRCSLHDGTRTASRG